MARTLGEEVAALGEGVRNLASVVEAMKTATERRLDPLWDEYQQQKGERRIIRAWLAALSLIVGVLAIVHR
jgi:hypothetical protein